MPKLVRHIEKKLNNVPKDFRLSKLRYAELKAIFDKKPLYQNVVWSKEQEDRFNSFWKKHYGKKISPSWHKLYQSANGVFDEKYFPEYFYTTKIEPLLNPVEYCNVLSDKSLLPFIFANNEELPYIPKVYLTCVNDIYRTVDNMLLSKDDAIEYLQDIGKCVFKPAVDSGSGSGVFISDINDGYDRNSDKSVSEIFDILKNNFIVQEIVKNNESVSKVCPKSLNTFRVITYYVENEIHHAPLVMRMGSGDKLVDNIHAGGLCIGVNIDGTLKQKAYQLGYGDDNKTFEFHPFTNVQFKDYYVGDIESVVNTAINLHKRIPQLGIVSWDFTINEREKPVLIEANCKDQSIWFPQVVNDTAFFGDDTAYFCGLISQ